MASGYFPLNAKHDKAGEALAAISEQLGALLKKGLPSSWDNSESDNAASDGGYETYLHLAHELIERCIKR